MLHLACKSKPLTKKGISCLNQDASSQLRYQFSAAIIAITTFLSEYHVTAMYPDLFEQALTSVLSKLSGGKWVFEIEARRRLISRAKEIDYLTFPCECL